VAKIATDENLLLLWQKIKLILDDKVDKVNGKGLSTNDYTTAEKEKLATLNNYVNTEITNLITAINAKIPAEASATNKLADQAFVNSSIATNTATFRGTYEKIGDLPTKTTINDLKINDYAFVIGAVDSNPEYSRYKYNGTEWVFEYVLNNSSFTAAQWEAINSGVTTGTIQQIGFHTEEIQYLADNKAEKSLVSSMNTRLQGAEGDIQNLQSTKANSADLKKVATTGSYDDLKDKPTIDTSLSETSTNAVQNKIVASALKDKLGKDDVDTEFNLESNNPISNSTVFVALSGKASTGEVGKDYDLSFANNKLSLSVKNKYNVEIASDEVSLAGISPEELTEAEIDAILEE
jgi:hypothetical protein